MKRVVEYATSMIDRDRVSRTTIDETGRQVSDFTVRLHGSQLEPEDIAIQSKITAAANAANYYGEDAVRFAAEVDKATEFLIGRVKAAGGDKRRLRDRRSRKRLTLECLNRADVPAQYLPGFWNTLWNGAKAIVGIAVPPPWSVVIAAVLFAVERYLGGE